MRKQVRHSVALRLALRFSLLVTVAVILLSVSFIGVLNLNVQNQKSEELSDAAFLVQNGLDVNENGEEIIDYEKFQLPYYVSFTAYKIGSETGDVITIGTNDPYLPLLAATGEKARKHIEKDFFLDGDLNIYYLTRELETSLSETVIIETALNMEIDSSTRMMSELPKAMLLLLIPVLILSFFISLIITKRTIQPVKKMTATAKELSTTNLDTLLPVSKHNDEIDDMAVTFNDLFKRIKIDFDRERQFTSDVSHELKTPVAVIMGQANLLKRWGKDDPGQLEKSLETIVKESKSMSAIIENLLQISRIENGRIKPKLERFKLDEMFERLKEECLSIKPDLQFEINCREKLYVIADKELLHQVFTVITSNSLKYCGAANIDPVKISCEAKEEKDSVYISIKDNGEGFDDKTVEHAFERFYRGDEAHTRWAGGSGLGLSIAKTIIESMEGTIRAENENGAKIIIKLSN